MGECVTQAMAPRDAGVADAATDGSTPADAGRPDGATSDTGLPVRDATTADADDTPISLPPTSRGCQCSTEGARPDARWMAAALALGAAVVTRRRRRR